MHSEHWLSGISITLPLISYLPFTADLQTKSNTNTMLGKFVDDPAILVYREDTPSPKSHQITYRMQKGDRTKSMNRSHAYNIYTTISVSYTHLDVYKRQLPVQEEDNIVRHEREH